MICASNLVARPLREGRTGSQLRNRPRRPVYCLKCTSRHSEQLSSTWVFWKKQEADRKEFLYKLSGKAGKICKVVSYGAGFYWANNQFWRGWNWRGFSSLSSWKTKFCDTLPNVFMNVSENCSDKVNFLEQGDFSLPQEISARFSWRGWLLNDHFPNSLPRTGRIKNILFSKEEV